MIFSSSLRLRFVLLSAIISSLFGVVYWQGSISKFQLSSDIFKQEDPTIAILAENIASSASVAKIRTATTTTTTIEHNTRRKNDTIIQTRKGEGSKPATNSTTTNNNNSNTHNNTSSIPRPHPHAGARDANGNWGYIANVKASRTWMLNRYYSNTNTTSSVHSFLPLNDDEDLNQVCQIPPTKAFEGKYGWDVLTKRVQVVTDTNESSVGNNFKILCMIYTHANNHHRIAAVVETWGWRCDGFFAASTLTTKDDDFGRLPTIDLPHFGEERYGNMWQKTRSMMGYAYDNYLQEYDYYYMAGDDTHLIVENLRHYLHNLQQRESLPYNQTLGLLLGSHAKPPKNKPYVGGGAGYVMDRVALKRLVEYFPQCSADAQVSYEDRLVSVCLRKLGVHPVDAADDEHRQRFHGLDPNAIVSGSLKINIETLKYWDKQQHHGNKEGMDMISSSSISFHLFKTPHKMKRHHAILYKSCPADTVLGKALLDK